MSFSVIIIVENQREETNESRTRKIQPKNTRSLTITSVRSGIRDSQLNTADALRERELRVQYKNK